MAEEGEELTFGARWGQEETDTVELYNGERRLEQICIKGDAQEL